MTQGTPRTLRSMLITTMELVKVLASRSSGAMAFLLGLISLMADGRQLVRGQA